MGELMSSTNLAIIWTGLVVAFVVIMFFAARGGKQKSDTNAEKQPGDGLPPAGAAESPPGGANPHL